MIISFDPAIINMSYCVVDIHTQKIRNWGIFSINGSDPVKNLADTLDSLNLLNGDKEATIVYELQPRCNMKTISITGQLQMYYTLKGPVKKMIGYHAKHKIKYPIDNPIPEKITKLKKGHYKTKKTLVEICNQVLIKNEEYKWIEWLKKQKKKDDLADSYIQALSYIKNNCK